MGKRPDLLDRRQRLAATLLMSAVDLPQEAGVVCKLWIAAARLTPGVSVNEVQPGAGRRDLLQRARLLIDEMLGELP